jgi:hypothetical protein
MKPPNGEWNSTRISNIPRPVNGEKTSLLNFSLGVQDFPTGLNSIKLQTAF